MSFDPTKVSYTPTWFVQAVVAIIMMLGAIAVGTYFYTQFKGMAFGTGEDF